MTGETPDHWRVDASTTTTDPLLINAMRGDLISFVSELPSNGTTMDAQIHDADDDADDE